jgi:sulfonate transport system ATP-binding protein
MAGVRLKQLTKQYSLAGQSFLAVDNVDATIKSGSFTVIVGKSGCGKTTLLRLLSGLEQKSAGKIEWLDCQNPSQSPKVGVVFQEPRLMPWLTVRENIAFSRVKTKQSAPGSESASIDGVESTLALLGLTPFRDAYPNQLSGGMAQRVSLGRTLYYNPDLILMDEPFGALDYFTRKRLQLEIADLFLNQKKTIIFVTHDVTEALQLAQNILVMDSGRIVREIPVDIPYPRQPTAVDVLLLQQEILATLGGL